MRYIVLDAVAFLAQFKTESNTLLLDVREEYEHDDQNIGGENIPMKEVFSHIERLSSLSSLYIYCKSGKRSKAVAYKLSGELKSCKIYSCQGGIQAYNTL